MISIKSEREIELMRQTCRLAADTLDHVSDLVVAGMTTLDVDHIVHEYIIKHGAYPSPLNYHGFPKSVCTSLNHVICHGIPSKKDKIKNGDILNIDVTTYLKNFHGDTNRTLMIGNVAENVKSLVHTTYDCMQAGIAQVKPGGHIGDIGAAIQEIAEGKGYSVVRDYCGHGIGRDFHEEPQVSHFGKIGTGEVMLPGMIFTIEPMINLGSYHCEVLEDGWTVVTRDGKWSAQFEHTVLVTQNGHEILTLSRSEREGKRPFDVNL